jgi:hypothetical protein
LGIDQVKVKFILNLVATQPQSEFETFVRFLWQLLLMQIVSLRTYQI